MPQNSNFRLPCGHRFFPKNGSYGYGAKSRRGPPRVHLGAGGVPLGKKNGLNRKKLPCPKIRIFDYPAVIGFSQKMEVPVMAPNHGGDTIESILGPMGSHWVQKMGQKRKKLPCPKIRIFDYPRSSIFPIKWKLRLWYQITVGTTWGPSWGPIGSKKCAKTAKNFMPQNSNYRLSRGHRFFAKNES